jgi:phosphomevalonate kinase
VLAGEYAVLDGGPALVLAVDRGVGVELRRGGPSVQIQTPDGDARFVAPALDGAAPGLYRFFDLAPVTGLSGKPGFGGSAAACVAACAASGRPLMDALRIHRAVQGGGSGVDVLASVHGGMGEVRDGAWLPRAPVNPVVVWTGQSARTGPRVARYLAWADRGSFVAQSRDAVARFAEDPVGALELNARALEAMARASGVDWDTPAHAALRALARVCGGACKPSGAGGGDCAVALFPDSDAQARFRAGLAALALPEIPVSPAPGAGPLPGPG